MNLTIIVPSENDFVKRKVKEQKCAKTVFSPSEHHPWVKESQSILRKYEKKVSKIFNLNSAYKLQKLMLQEEKDLQPPRSAYSYFFKDKRKTMVSVHSEKNGFQIAKMLASVWRQLPTSVKDGYYILEESDKKRYVNELERITQKRDFLQRMISNMEYNLN